MRKIFSLIFIFTITVFCEAQAAPTETWNSIDGLKRLERSQFKNDFYQLINFYQPQINPLYCTAASSVIILNAVSENIPSQKEIEVKAPESLGGNVVEFCSYSQLNFFNEKTDKIKKRDIIELKAPKQIINGKEIYDPGLSLADLSQILSKVYFLKTKIKYAKSNNDKSVKDFRDDLKKYLSDNKNFLIVNFDGKEIGRNVGGHMSPLAAYDEASDSVLVLDVALHRGAWYWVQILDLYRAMNSKDGDLYRGYIIISKS